MIIIIRLLLFLFFDLRILRQIESALGNPERCSYREIKKQEKVNPALDEKE
jgi:hypothetical protein